MKTAKAIYEEIQNNIETIVGEFEYTKKSIANKVLVAAKAIMDDIEDGFWKYNSITEEEAIKRLSFILNNLERTLDGHPYTIPVSVKRVNTIKELENQITYGYNEHMYINRFVFDAEGKRWNVSNDNTVYIGRALEWETPVHIPLKTWAEAKGLLGTLSDQKKATEYWSKQIHGF